MATQNATGKKYFVVTWQAPSAAYATDNTMFIAPIDCVLESIQETHSVIGSDGSAVNIMPTKDTGTAAPGAGTDLLVNNSNAGFDLKGAINTPQYGVFATTLGLRNFARGDRLGLDYAGVQTAVVGTAITAVFSANVDSQ